MTGKKGSERNERKIQKERKQRLAAHVEKLKKMAAEQVAKHRHTKRVHRVEVAMLEHYGALLNMFEKESAERIGRLRRDLAGKEGYAEIVDIATRDATPSTVYGTNGLAVNSPADLWNMVRGMKGEFSPDRLKIANVLLNGAKKWVKDAKEDVARLDKVSQEKYLATHDKFEDYQFEEPAFWNVPACITRLL